MSVKIVAHAKKTILRILAHVFVRNDKYLKIIADTSVITCDEIISVMDIVSIKVINTIATNVTVKKEDIKLIAIFCTQYY